MRWDGHVEGRDDPSGHAQLIRRSDWEFRGYSRLRCYQGGDSRGNDHWLQMPVVHYFNLQTSIASSGGKGERLPKSARTPGHAGWNEPRHWTWTRPKFVIKPSVNDTAVTHQPPLTCYDARKISVTRRGGVGPRIRPNH